MVSLAQIRSSNAHIATSLRPDLVAVFAGATSGIGEASLKQFAKHVPRPRIYFIGRSKASGERIRKELQELNPRGEYVFLGVDVSLLRSVDDVCREIRAKEASINLLFLTTGTMVSGKDTDEGLHYPVAVTYHARFRFIVNLLPALQGAPGLRRVVTVFTGTKEGAVQTGDLQERRVSLLAQRGHLSAMTTLSLEAAARAAPGVSLVHDYPGFVRTNYGRDVRGAGAAVLRGVLGVVYLVFGPLFVTPADEAGERHLFLATSARFPPARGGGEGEGEGEGGVPLPGGVEVARGTDGRGGSGVYSVDGDAESAPPKVEQLLAGLREDGTAQKVWSQAQEEFVRITGATSVQI